MPSILQNVIIAGRPVGQVGYGLLGLSWAASIPSEAESLALLKTAVEAGATAWSTGTFYNPPDKPYDNIKLIKKFFDAYPNLADKVTINLKGGIKHGLPVPLAELDALVEEEIHTCLDILGKDRGIDVFCLARLNADDVVEDVKRVLKRYQDKGLVKSIGLSEVKAATMERASKIIDVACVELEVSLWSYTPEIRAAVQFCSAHKIPILAYSPLGQGFLTRKYAKPEDIPRNSIQAMMPRFQGQAFYKNLELVGKLDEIAERKGISTGELALAWLTGLDPMIVPIPGSANVARVRRNTAAVDVVLSAEESEEIDRVLAAVEVAGGRYPSLADGTLMV